MDKVKEGKIEINVPTGRIYDAAVFYNKDAEIVRDISVAVLSVFKTKVEDIEMLDALSASGVSGIRYVKEVGVKAVLNDNNPKAIELIKNNIELNSVEVEVSNKDANLIMRERLFDFIDLDPFGSPSIFMDSVARSLKYNRLLAVSATDGGALSGSFPNACFRKYAIKVGRTPYYSELGIRVLITFIMNSFARYDKAFRPLLFLIYKHYYRVYGIIEGSGKVTKMLKQYGTIDNIGPIYLGPIKDDEFIKQVIDELEKRDFKNKDKEIAILTKILREINVPFYYDISKMHLAKVPAVHDIILKLKENGFEASRSSLCDTGVKTNAKLEEFMKIL
ncbi:MAG: hypothetical protein KJ906_03005 [Nanoarchaeota archaeon]|nr:hypothetical protein [Nanoarchaeota archaeon]